MQGTKKTIPGILSSLALSALILIITSLIQSRLLTASLQWIIAIAVFLVSVIIFTSTPEGTFSRWIRKIVAMPARLVSDYRKEPDDHPFSTMFDFSGEQVQIVYTCRSRIDKASCPQCEGSDAPQLKHVIHQHIPVDEFLTHQLMLQWYRGQVRGLNREGIIERFKCSCLLDRFEDPPAENELWNRADLPEFVFNNLIIIGENSCANLMLRRLKPILNFYPRFYKISPFGQRSDIPKIRIDLMVTPSNGNNVAEDEKALLRTHFHKASANAVAMVYYAPNPFNVQKHVLILFGCHRVGQYLLEDWLHSPESRSVLRRLLKSKGIPTSALGQIALHSPFVVARVSEDYEFTRIQLAKNIARRKLPFFPFAVRSNRIARDGFEVDIRAVQQNPMVDISLTVELSKHDSQLSTVVDDFFRKKLPFLQGHYWESQVQDIGLHVTLYEFATHGSHDTLAQGIEQFTELQEVLAERLRVLDPPHLSLVGCEIFPASIVLYADLPTAFLDAVREICQGSLPESGYFNRLIVPFPMHCTVIRFSREFTNRERHELLTFADPYRKHVFGEFQVQTLSLLLVRKQPYQDIEHRFDISVV